MVYDVTHKTTYEYETPVSISQHLLHLRPRIFLGQDLFSSSLEVTPAPRTEISRKDYYGNELSFLGIESPHTVLSIVSRCRVRVRAPELPDAGGTTPWEEIRESLTQDKTTGYFGRGEFLFDSPYAASDGDFQDYAAQAFRPGRPILSALIDLTQRIYRDFTFDKRATNIATPLKEVFRKRRGVCQDFAHFGIACLRSLGLPARYVSGYIETIPPPGKPRLAGADASHAWLSLWCGGDGWIDADPTNNQLVGDRHVTVAWGRDFCDVSPVRGIVIGGGDHELEVGVDVIPIAEQ